MAKMFKLYKIIGSCTLLFLAMLLMGLQMEFNQLRDPTEPPPAFAPAKSAEINYNNMSLSAIFIRPNTRWAVINGQTYHEGDAIGEYIITNITIDAVELIDSTNTKEVLKLATPVKKAALTKEE